MGGDPKRVLLAYSGGLDTSCILKYLLDQGLAVVCYCANVGQTEDFAAVEAKAKAVGAEACVIDDLQAEFVTDYIFPFCQWAGTRPALPPAMRMRQSDPPALRIAPTARYEGRYMLGTAIARPCIAKGMVRVAREFNCGAISHGATGALRCDRVVAARVRADLLSHKREIETKTEKEKRKKEGKKSGKRQICFFVTAKAARSDAQRGAHRQGQRPGAL